jgi:hypothetical protein
MNQPISPQDFERDPARLEPYLVGFHLADVIVALGGGETGEGGSPAAGPALSELLGDRQGEVLTQGLRKLPPDIVSQLLRRPDLLLDLQELTLCYGGPYWQGLRQQVPERRGLQAPDVQTLLRGLAASHGSGPAQQGVAQGAAGAARSGLAVARAGTGEDLRREGEPGQRRAAKASQGRRRRVLPWAVAAACLVVGVGVAAIGWQRTPAALAVAAARQHYSRWVADAGGRFWYRFYYFRASPADAEYRHHYVIFDPQRPDFLYYFNPERQLFWGRMPVGSGGRAEPRYSVLAEKDRRAAIDEIPESAFPEPGPMPLIPGSTDHVPMEPPPPGLPGQPASDLPRLK